MTASDLVAALRPVIHALDALGVPFYIGGSLASSTHGIARSTLDTDVVVAMEPHHVDALVERLSSAYYIPIDRLRSAAIDKSSCNLIHLTTMFKIDLFVSTGRPFDRSALDRARPLPLDEGSDPLTVPMATAEDTVLAKLEWFRRGGEVSERQWSDVVGVLKVNSDVDQNYLRDWANSLGVTDLLERALMDATR